MALAMDIASWALIILGSFFTIVGMLGLLRMPELFTRMHAASVMETLGAGFLILGMLIQAGVSLVAFKLLFILALFFLTDRLHYVVRGSNGTWSSAIEIDSRSM